MPAWAVQVAEKELSVALPRRWAHSQGVAARAGRYGANSLVGRFIRRAEPDIRAAVGRVEAAPAAQPRYGYVPAR